MPASATTHSKSRTIRGSRSSKVPPPSKGGLVCKWIGQNLVHGEGDFFAKPFRLTEEQKLFIWRCYELRQDGRRRYSRVLRGRPKGDGKTELAAAIGCAELGLAGQFGFPASPNIPVGAASFEQADLLFGSARVMISEGPLAPFFEVFDTEILRKDGPGRMYRIAAAAGTNDGGRPTFFLADELHEWTDRKERVHLVLANGLAKRQGAWELAISTAGSDKSTLLGQMYDRGRAIEAGEVEDDSFLFDWLEAPGDFDLEDPEQLEAALRSCNPHIDKFVSLESRMQRFHEIPRFEFERYYLNRWTESDDGWISAAEWDACVGEPEFDEDDDCYVGVDIGGQKDAHAVVVGAFRDDKFHVRAEILTPTDTYKPPVSDVREAVGVLSGELRLREVAFDPWHFTESAEILEQRGLMMVRFEQNNARMCPASETLFNLIKERRLVHNGDSELRRHVLSAVAGQTNRGWRIDKRKSKNRIDACVALAMAADRAVANHHGKNLVPFEVVGP